MPSGDGSQNDLQGKLPVGLLEILVLFVCVCNVSCIRFREFIAATGKCVTLTDDIEIQGLMILHVT